MVTWESKLLDWAYKGIDSPANELPLNVVGDSLKRAYDLCEAITYAHSRTFFLASSLLPAKKRQAVRALYAFCRTSDDIVDRTVIGSKETSLQALESWRQRAVRESPSANEGLILAWADAQATYRIPRLFAEQLIDGVSRDLVQKRYSTFEELATYCYHVASTVGLMAMHIIGFSGPDAVSYAVKLGIALQLTNILRDVGEDWAAGRLYLPLEELAAFGLTPDDVAAGVVTKPWRRFMQHQIARVHGLYAQALPGIQMLHRDGRFAIAAAAELYATILDDIAAHDMDVFHRRAHVSELGKLRRLPGIWWRTEVTGYPQVHHQVRRPADPDSTCQPGATGDGTAPCHT